MTRRTVLLLLAAAVLAASVGALLQPPGALRPVEHASYDARFGIRGTQAPRPDVVVVGIDDRTLDNAPLPLDRTRHAAVIDRLARAGAKVIAYDVQFTTQSEDPDADNALIEAVRAAAPRVVLATTQVSSTGETGIFGGGEGLAYSKATPAASDLPVDDDGRVRRMTFATSKLVSFPLAAARVAAGRRIPTPGGATAPIDFPGPAGTFRRLSFADVERGRFSAAAVRGKVVVVGATAPALQDMHRVPLGDAAMAGPEVQAAAIATALDDFPLRPASDLVDWLLALGLGLVAPLVALRLGPALAFAAGLAATVAFLVVAQVAFNHGTVLAVVPPVAAALTGMVAALFVAHPARSRVVDGALLWVTRGGSRTQRLRALLLICAGLGSVAVALGLQAGNVLRRLELATVDQRFDVRGTQPPPADVTLVAIDDKAFEVVNQRWPFPREVHARVVRNLTKAGAKVIAYDVQFTEDEQRDPKGDEKLIEAVRASPRVVLATTEVGELGDVAIFDSQDSFAYSGATAGNSNYTLDTDGRIRRMHFRIDNLEAFPIAATRLALGHRPALPQGDSAWIDFVGPPTTVKRISFGDVYANRFPAAAVRGKIVVVGATAPTLQDLHAASTTHGSLMPGPEVHANAIETALAGFPLRGVAGWVNTLAVLLLGLIAPLAGLRLGVRTAVGIGLATLAGFLVYAQLRFNDGAIVNVVYPLLAALGGIVATGSIHGLTVAFEREQARDAFARFVPEAVVDQVLADAEGIRLGGVRRDCTVMFSDLRGFTSFSESLEPERVIEALNMYLTEMSEAILDHGGTLVAYMGDGIMAVFGAPLQQDDHADRALDAARDMLGRMERYNGWLRAEGLHAGGFKMGIGLNSGPVMSGNVGSERRLEYTALGDTTNTAARLEGMTKGTPHQLYVADATRAKLTRPAEDLMQVGEVEVRGRVAKVLLWSLADQPEPPADPGAADAAGAAEAKAVEAEAEA